MEGSSAFDAAAPAAQQGDPFGENGEGDFQQGADPFGEETAPPRVDREGNEIEEEAELAAAQASAEEAGIDTTAESSVAEAAQGAAEQAQAVADPPPSAPTAGAETASSAEPTSGSEQQSAADLNGAGAPAEGSPAATAPAQEEQPESTLTTADGSPAEAQGAGEDPSPAATESSEGPGAAAGSDGIGVDMARQEVAAEREGGDEAEAPKPKKGLRAYRLFVPEGNGKFSELSWHEKDGKLVKPGTFGAKKQTVVLTREQDGALHHGFNVLGCPEGGAKLVAVADSQWTVRHVEPDPVQPVRQRLKIR